MSKNDKHNPKTPPAAQAHGTASPSSAQNPTASADSAPVDELTLLGRKLSEYENDLQRLAAEFDNYKKRVEREKQEARLRGKAEALAPFLDMGEVFEKALTHAHGKNTDSKAMHDGLLLLQRQMHSTLVSLGVKEISCVGPAHHAYHEVLLQVPGGESGEIAQVLRKGYVMGEYVLRPAQVSVYIGAPAEKDESKNEEANEGASADETSMAASDEENVNETGKESSKSE